jgi:hypothetical protein
MRSPSSRAVLALVVLALCGCSTTYAGDSKKDFIAKGNEICKTTGATVVPTLKDLQNGHVPTLAELRSFVGDVALPALQKRVDKLRQLEPPSADRKTIDDIIRTTQKGIDRIRNSPSQLVDADPFLDANVDVRSYGLTSCVLGV